MLYHFVGTSLSSSACPILMLRRLTLQVQYIVVIFSFKGKMGYTLEVVVVEGLCLPDMQQRIKAHSGFKNVVVNHAQAYVTEPNGNMGRNQ